MPRKRRRAQVVALGGVVVDHVEDHLDARRVQRPHHGLELGDAAAGVPVGGVLGSAGRRSRTCCNPSSSQSAVEERWSWRNWCTGISSTAVTPSVLRCSMIAGWPARHTCRVGPRGCRGELGHALDVGLVDHRLVVRRLAASGRPAQSKNGLITTLGHGVPERIDHRRLPEAGSPTSGRTRERLVKSKSPWIDLP